MLKQIFLFSSCWYSSLFFSELYTLKNTKEELCLIYLHLKSVSEGHPDKVADQISDALIDNFLAYDKTSKVACETLVTTGQVVLAGEVKSEAYLDVQSIAREVINGIGYTKGEYMFNGDSCGVISAIHEQSPDINQGVDREVAMKLSKQKQMLKEQEIKG